MDAAAEERLARLVAALAQPDATRGPADFVPLADAGDAGGPGGDDVDAPVAVGQVLVERGQGGGSPTWLRLAWTSPVSGRHLLVSRQGARHALLSPGELAAALARGDLVARPGEGAVEAMLQRLTGAPGG